MADGYVGRVGLVDLSTRRIRTLSPGWEFYRRYLGGRNIALHFLMEGVPAGADALGKSNRIVIATSVLGGSEFPGTSRFTVASKSPLTGGYGEGEAGGWFGPELKMAGFDAIVVDGESQEPVYLWIKDGRIEIRDALDIWGKRTAEGQELLLQDTGDAQARVLQIGPAGENLVRYACLVSDLRDFCGRSGLGAVWGAKGLRAVVVRGNDRVSVADPNRLRAVIKWFGENYTKNQGLSEKGRMGTMLGVVPMSEMGLLPTRNFREGSFSLAEEIGGENLHATLVGAREGCRACPVRCKRVVTGEQLDKRYGGPEFESIGSLGSNCCIGDPNALVKANELCNSLGLDTISTGVTIAFAMECFEARILTYDDTDGENIRFGNASAMLQLIEMIGLRRGIGGLLAEGSLRAAEKLGRGSERFSMSVKGQELPAHDPRGKWAVALGYAVSPTGADHLQAAHDTWFERDPHPEIPYGFVDVSDLWPFGIYEPMEATSLDAKKVRAFAVLQRWWSLHNVLDLCIFVSTPEYRMTGLDRLVEITHAVTGWNVTDSELLRAGELGITLARMFNYREGFSRADDRLPERLHEDLPYCHGSHPGISRDEFSSALSLYYSLMGWDAEGQPHEWKKIELGLANCCSDYTKREEA